MATRFNKAAKAKAEAEAKAKAEEEAKALAAKSAETETDDDDTDDDEGETNGSPVAVTEMTIGNRMLASAKQFAEHEAKHVEAQLIEFIDSADKVATGTFAMVNSLVDDYLPENADMTDLVTIIPRPHTKERPNNSGNFPSKFTHWELKGDGKYGDVNHDWFTDAVRFSKLGKPWAERKEHLETLDNPKANVQGVPQAMIDEFAKDLFARRDALKEATNKLNNLRTAYVRAANFVHQWFAVESVPRIALDLNYDAKGNVRNGGPIKVYEAKVRADGSIMTDEEDVPVPASGSLGDSITLSTFLRYNAARAIELGGGYEGLRKSLEREGETGPAAELPKAIRTPETFDKVFQLLTARCEEMATAHDAEDQAALLKRLEAKSQDAMVLAVYNMRAWCDDVLRHKTLLRRAVKLSADDANEDDTEKANAAEAAAKAAAAKPKAAA